MDSSAQAGPRKLILVGNPNVGKSVIFGYLTGRYVTVSNYPGTTVEISRGTMRLGGRDYLIIDTPGVNSLVPQSEDERITRDIIFRERPDLLVQIADAKNLRRTLLITSQLAEFGIPMILVLNMMDEAHERGIEVDAKGISALFGIPVIETVATYGEGLPGLTQVIQQARTPNDPVLAELPEVTSWLVAPKSAQANGPAAALGAALVQLTGPSKAALKSPVLTTEVIDSLPSGANGNGKANGKSGSRDKFPYLLAIECLQTKDEGLRKQIEASLDPDRLAALTESIDLFRLERKRSLAAHIERERSVLLDNWVDQFKRTQTRTALVKENNRAFRLSFSLLLLGFALLFETEVAKITGWPSLYSLGENLIQSIAPAITSFFSVHTSILAAVLVGLQNPDSGVFEFGLLQTGMHLLTMIAPIIIPFAFAIKQNKQFANTLGNWTRVPRTGIFILIVVLLMLYEFVGVAGAQELVGLLEKVLFGHYLTPFLQKLIPASFVYDLLVGEYGLISVGLTYSVAIVLPVVSTFFIAFSLLEDSGYLPRLAILSDKIFRVMGLNGKAILPMVLGLGCDTMATMTTRILSTKKERLIATLLLALGVPCSAQLGIILGIGARSGSKALLVVFGVVLSQLLVVGFLSSRLIKGERGDFIFEIPPIRVPQFRNVWLKTKNRVIWFLREAVPLFVLGTLILFGLDRLLLGTRSLDRSVLVIVLVLLLTAAYNYSRQKRRVELHRRPLTLAGQRDQSRMLALKKPMSAWVKALPLACVAASVLLIDRVMAVLAVAPRSGLALITDLLRPLLAGILHLPAQTAKVFVLGFLRRDYGAAGLIDMADKHQLITQQIVVSLIVLTLFVPCIANFFVMIKEQGLRTAAIMSAFITPYAIFVGAIVSFVLRTFHFLE